MENTPSTTAAPFDSAVPASKKLDVFNIEQWTNPSTLNTDQIRKIKNKAEELLDLMALPPDDVKPDPVTQGEARRRYALAKTHLETAVMFAVKALFVGYRS